MKNSDSNPKMITRLLNEASTGNQKAASELLPLAYKELHALASKRVAVVQLYKAS